MFLNLNLPIKTRLANYKTHLADVSPCIVVRGANGKPIPWRNYLSQSPDYSAPSVKPRLVWFDGLKSLQATWRFVGYADEIIQFRLRHTGYYADSFQHETLRGIVAQLPARDGVCYYLAGYISTDTDQICLTGTIEMDKDDAARSADHYAERAAESSRDDRAKDAAEQEMEQLKANCSEYRARIRALRASIADLQQAKRKAKERIEALADNYWLAVE